MAIIVLPLQEEEERRRIKRGKKKKEKKKKKKKKKNRKRRVFVRRCDILKTRGGEEKRRLPERTTTCLVKFETSNSLSGSMAADHGKMKRSCLYSLIYLCCAFSVGRPYVDIDA
uniref:Uncharacterized protein n=1 Tax=Vespula pensylvanica TaxID=30213 RepID=A0A834U965_VESPE|nr:hypothetical protein H0235_008453 [Vespula pensylvanica]